MLCSAYSYTPSSKSTWSDLTEPLEELVETKIGIQSFFKTINPYKAPDLHRISNCYGLLDWP